MSEELGRRFGLPKWQYTSSATHANTEAIRVARVATGREKVVMFDGKYHGHLDEALVELDEAGEVVIEERGVPEDTVEGTVIVPFNDPAALARALEAGDVAIVLTEPAITNNIGLLLPDEGFHAELRRLTRLLGAVRGRGRRRLPRGLGLAPRRGRGLSDRRRAGFGVPPLDSP